MDAIRKYLEDGEADGPVVGLMAFTLEDIGDGVLDETGDDETVDAEDGLEVSAAVAPDLLRHDAKYHHGRFDEAGYEAGRVRCRYRDAREAALAGKSGEEADLALAGLNPESVEGEEIDRADELTGSGVEVSQTEKAEKTIGRPRKAEADTLGAYEHRRKVGKMGERERALFRKIMTVRVRRSQVKKAKRPGWREEYARWDGEAKRLGEQYDELRRELGRDAGSRGDSPATMLMGDRARSLRNRMRLLQRKLKYETGYDVGKTGTLSLRPGLEAVRSELEAVRNAYGEQIRADRARLDADEARGIRNERVCTLYGDPCRFVWSRGKWVMTEATPKTLAKLRQAAERQRMRQKESIRELTPGEREIRDFSRRAADVSKRLGIDERRSRMMLAECAADIDKAVPTVRELRAWMERSGIGDGRTASDRRDAARAYLDEVSGRGRVAAAGAEGHHGEVSAA